mgnify:CR=1 FL=1
MIDLKSMDSLPLKLKNHKTGNKTKKIDLILNDYSTSSHTVGYIAFLKGPFIILCQLGKIKNTKGHKDENRNRCRAIC